MSAFVVLDLVSSVVDRKERLQNDLFCVS